MEFEARGQHGFIVTSQGCVDDTGVELKGSCKGIVVSAVKVLVLLPGHLGNVKQASKGKLRVVDVTESFACLAPCAVYGKSATAPTEVVVGCVDKVGLGAVVEDAVVAQDGNRHQAVGSGRLPCNSNKQAKKSANEMTSSCRLGCGLKYVCTSAMPDVAGCNFSSCKICRLLKL